MEIEKYSPEWVLNEIRNAKTNEDALYLSIAFHATTRHLSDSCSLTEGFEKSKEYKRLKEIQKTEENKVFLKWLFFPE